MRQRIFQPGEQLTAQDVNEYLVNHVPSLGMVYDTGWVDLSDTLGPEYDAVWFKARRVGIQVEIRGGVDGEYPANTTATITSSTGVPFGWRPWENSHGAAWLNGGHIGTAWIRPDGTIAVAHQASSQRVNCQFTLNYFVDGGLVK